MSERKILFISTSLADINTLIELFLVELEYDLIRYDAYQNNKQLNEIEEICRKFKPKAVILANDDFSTPLEQNLCSELRESPHLAGIGFLLVFRPGKNWRLLKLDCDADEYIRLPFTRNELDERLRALIDKYSST